MDPPRSPFRAWAPGLGIRKKKIDPYDPKGFFQVNNNYSFLKENQAPETAGTWTTYDPDSNHLKLDQVAQKERLLRSAPGNVSIGSDSPFSSGMSFVPTFAAMGMNSAHDSIAGSGRNASRQLPISSRNPPAQRDSSVQNTPIPYSQSSACESPGSCLNNPQLNYRFENPELDVDADVRQKFLSVQQLSRQMVPKSEFEQRNTSIWGTKNSAPASSSVKNIIGGKMASILNQSADTRGEDRDRFGNYIGKNRGLMKKYLEENRIKAIQLRDAEMVHATAEKRKWESMNEEERVMELARLRRPLTFYDLKFPGADPNDVEECTEIPENYNSRDRLRFWQTGTASSASVATKDVEDQDFIRFASSTTPTPKIRPLRHESLPPSMNSNDSSIGNDDSSIVLDEGLELYPLADVSIAINSYRDKGLAEDWKRLKEQCTRRGRIAMVRLHPSVRWSPGAVADRVFGGVVQEIQYFPRDHSALIVFLYTSEAEAFVKHMAAAKAAGGHEFRQLQMSAEWYKGQEHTAIYRMQRNIAVAGIDQQATRAILLANVPVDKSKSDLNKEIAICLTMILVKVIIVAPKLRLNWRRGDGNQVILQFATIKDAWNALKLFNEGKIGRYEMCSATWVKDPCDRAPGKIMACTCLHCRPNVEENVTSS